MAVPSATIFVGDLPGETDEITVQSIFGAYGNVKAIKLLQPVASGKRAAIIEYQTVEEASWLVENLHGNIPQGLAEAVVVKFKETTAPKGSYGKGVPSLGKAGPHLERYTPYSAVGGKDVGKGVSKGGPVDGCSIWTLVNGIYESGALPGGQRWENDEGTLFISGLPHDTTDLELYKIFGPFGATAPNGVKAMLAEDRVSCKGIGFVNFLDSMHAMKAIQTLNGTTMPDGTFLKVSVKRTSDMGFGCKGKPL